MNLCSLKILHKDKFVTKWHLLSIQTIFAHHLLVILRIFRIHHIHIQQYFSILNFEWYLVLSAAFYNNIQGTVLKNAKLIWNEFTFQLKLPKICKVFVNNSRASFHGNNIEWNMNFEKKIWLLGRRLHGLIGKMLVTHSIMKLFGMILLLFLIHFR